MSYAAVPSCRICGNSFLQPVLDLGMQALQGQFVKADEPDPYQAPVQVVRCQVCGLVQSKFAIDPKDQFTSYFYVSSVSATMRSHLDAFAKQCGEMLPEADGSSVCDIGSNDGALLAALPFSTINRVGIDPSDVPVAYPSIRHIKGFFPNDMMLTNQFDLVTTVACFYSTPKPVEFAEAVKKILSPKGLWVVEVADLHAVLQNIAYDFWCLEHVSLFSPMSMNEIAKRARLRIVRMERNGCNGGSMRYYLTHQSNGAYFEHPDAAQWQANIDKELAHAVDLNSRPEAFASFESSVKRTKSFLLEEVQKAMTSPKPRTNGKVHILGASTKMNVVLQYAGLDKRVIEMASDRDPRKAGRVTPGTRIPIVSEEDSRKEFPSLYITVLSMFKKEIAEREKAAGSITPICFALPWPEII